MSRILVWDVPTRLFHWLLALSFAGAFVSGDSERWRDLHVMLGYTMIGLIGFRLVWGIFGTRYARFSAFAFGPSSVLAYLRSLLSRRPARYLGHNPAGSWAIYLMLALGIVAGVTGYAVFEDIGGEWMEALHEGAANAMLAVVAVHIAGVILGSLRHHENLVGAMVSGCKSGEPGEASGRPRRIAGAVLLGGVLAFWAGALQAPAPGDKEVHASNRERVHEAHEGERHHP